jgi:hypothetical protein
MKLHTICTEIYGAEDVEYSLWQMGNSKDLKIGGASARMIGA